MKLRKRAPRGAVAMLVSLTAALGVAACGSSTNNGTTNTTGKNASATTTKSGSGNGTSQTAFATCLKQHGVTLPKRPAGGFRGGVGGRTGTNASPPSGTSTTGRRFGPGGGGGFAGGGGGFLGGGAGGNSKLAKALKACGSKLGSRAGRFGGQGFPGGGGSAGPRRGQVPFTTAELKAFVTCVRKNGYAAMPEPNTSGKFPSSVQKNAKFQAASRKCVSILQSGIHAKGQSTTSTSSSAASA
jgi:hypothetical protein